VGCSWQGVLLAHLPYQGVGFLTILKGRIQMADVKKPSFGAYLLAIIFPPGYFFSRKRTDAGIVSLVLLLISLPLLMLGGFGIIVWFVDAIWAAWNLRYELMNVQVNAQARAIAKELAAQKEEQ
jgi:hypothetical protein